MFKNWFIFCSKIHNYDTVSSSADKLLKPLYRNDSYAKNSVIVSAINCYNKTQNILRNQSLKPLYPKKSKLYLLKDVLTNTNNDPSFICRKLYWN